MQLADHIFLNQNCLFVYIVMAALTAREMGLTFTGADGAAAPEARLFALDKIHGVLRIAYHIQASFDFAHSLDPYNDRALVPPSALHAAERFDKALPGKQLVQVTFDRLPQQIAAPAMRVRDMNNEIREVEKTFEA